MQFISIIETLKYTGIELACGDSKLMVGEIEGLTDGCKEVTERGETTEICACQKDLCNKGNKRGDAAGAGFITFVGMAGLTFLN